MKVNSGGGQWQPPTFDSQGHLYLEVANPAPFVGDKSYPGKKVYAERVQPSRPEPVHRHGRRAQPGHRQAHLALPADPARHPRLGPQQPGPDHARSTARRRSSPPARPGSRSPTTPRPASCCGRPRSARTTATTTTASTPSIAPPATPRSRSRRTDRRPACSAASRAPTRPTGRPPTSRSTTSRSQLKSQAGFRHAQRRRWHGRDGRDRPGDGQDQVAAPVPELALRRRRRCPTTWSGRPRSTGPCGR